MDHIFKAAHTSEYNDDKIKEMLLPASYRKARRTWSTMQGFTPVEKLFAMVVFGQIIKNTLYLFDFKLPSMLHIFQYLFGSSEEEKSKAHIKKPTSQIFFMMDERNTNIAATENLKQLESYLEL